MRARAARGAGSFGVIASSGRICGGDHTGGHTGGGCTGIGIGTDTGTGTSGAGGGGGGGGGGDRREKLERE
jgi:hypothetical protein